MVIDTKKEPTDSKLKPPKKLSEVISKLNSVLSGKPSSWKKVEAALAEKETISSGTDEIDDIYKEKDPIEVSLTKRADAGSTNAVVQDKNGKAGKFFFTFRVTGP